jgi:hypothetical protein
LTLARWADAYRLSLAPDIGFWAWQVLAAFPVSEVCLKASLKDIRCAKKAKVSATSVHLLPTEYELRGLHECKTNISVQPETGMPDGVQPGVFSDV